MRATYIQLFHRANPPLSRRNDPPVTYDHPRSPGFHRLGCWLDETGKALAAILRPGNAGSNTACDHFRVLGLALAQLPAEDLDREILVRTDIGGQTQAFTQDCHDAGIRFSVGYELSETVRQTILELPQSAWVQAINADGEDRDGAWVAELTSHLKLSAWPEGSRLICRRERPHPGAQFQIFDEHGYRHTCFLTDQTGHDIAALELRHRARARVKGQHSCWEYPKAGAARSVAAARYPVCGRSGGDGGSQDRA